MRPWQGGHRRRCHAGCRLTLLVTADWAAHLGVLQPAAACTGTRRVGSHAVPLPLHALYAVHAQPVHAPAATRQPAGLQLDGNAAGLSQPAHPGSCSTQSLQRSPAAVLPRAAATPHATYAATCRPRCSPQARASSKDVPVVRCTHEGTLYEAARNQQVDLPRRWACR